ncbi:MAG: DUF4190 domain-containing protein [Polyangiaceae bacterium]
MPETDWGREQDPLPPLVDPYFASAPAPPPPTPSRLAIASVVLAFQGPAGAVAAIAFGVAARRDVARGLARGGRGLAAVGMTLGVLLSLGWLAFAGFLWQRHHHALEVADLRPQPIQAPDEPQAPQAPAPSSAPKVSPDPGPGGTVPKTTTLSKEGALHVVDVGYGATSLRDELAKQRLEAEVAKETLLLMTTSARCEPCAGVARSLADPQMQTALVKTRLVRVDIAVFRDDLEALRVPYDSIPGFFLLGVDLAPRDGINGGEWGEDIAANIAPVLGAFVRGKYTERKSKFNALPGGGIRL